jgi:uncharacterized membrane protein YkoI
MRTRWQRFAAVALSALVLGGGVLGASALDSEQSSSGARQSLLGFLDDDPVVPPGTLDDGQEFLPQATLTLEEAIAAAQGATPGAIGEVDLEQFRGRLVFNVDVGDADVKVDATTGDVLGSVTDD